MSACVVLLRFLGADACTQPSTIIVFINLFLFTRSTSFAHKVIRVSLGFAGITKASTLLTKGRLHIHRPCNHNLSNIEKYQDEKYHKNSPDERPKQPKAAQISPKQPKAAQSSPSSPKQPKAAHSSPKRSRAAQSSPEQPSAALQTLCYAM